MEGRERSEQAPVVLGHGEHALRRGVSHGGAHRISKRDPHLGSIDAEAGAAGAAKQSGARGSLEAATTRRRAS